MTERPARKPRAGSKIGMPVLPNGERQMPEEITFNRRRFLGGAAMTIVAAQLGMIGCAQEQSSEQTQGTLMSEEIRPFRIDVPEEELVDLRQRIAATRWPDQETVSDGSQGAQLANLQELVRYWGDEYDWRKAEAKLNALPQFSTEIDGLDIHFIRVPSRHEDALPLLMTHGW